MVQPQFVGPLIDTHEPTDAWLFTYEADSDEGQAQFWAAITLVGAGEYSAYIHIYADNIDWNVYGENSASGQDEFQRLWFNSFDAAVEHVQSVFTRATRPTLAILPKRPRE